MAFAFVDAHIHFWDPALLPYPWLSGQSGIAKAHVPADFRAEVGDRMPQHLVFVQAECDRAKYLDEVAWVEGLARAEPHIGAIVAFAPMDQGQKTAMALDQLSSKALVRGIRHLIQDDADPELCRRPAYIAGVQSVGARGLCFELCLRHEQLPGAIELVRACPDTRFVLDHGGKPAVRTARLDPWRAHIGELASFPHVVCKLSGLVTEADAGAWRLENLRPYVDHLLASFGPERLLFGSDWPVVKLASSYEKWLETARALLDHLTPGDLDSVFFDNARRTYRLT
jgi:L-fuconolactonase